MVEGLLLGQHTVYVHIRIHRDRERSGDEHEIAVEDRKREGVERPKGPWRPEQQGTASPNKVRCERCKQQWRKKVAHVRAARVKAFYMMGQLMRTLYVRHDSSLQQTTAGKTPVDKVMFGFKLLIMERLMLCL